MDYCALNKHKIKDKVLLPRIDGLLDRSNRAKVFSKIDLGLGYHQIGIEEGSIEKMAFWINFGHWEILVMLFGLCNVLVSFQRLL